MGIWLQHLQKQILCEAGHLVDVARDKGQIALCIQLNLLLNIVSIKEVHAGY